jgi:xanthine dehydrogenase accessory factor
MEIRVAIKGGGDLGTGAILRLHRAGFRVWVTELPQPLAIRRAVAVANAVYEGAVTIEGHTARRVEDPGMFPLLWAQGEIPVLVDPQGESIRRLRPEGVVDAIMAKRNTGTAITDTLVVVAIGPGFTAGVDCHAVVETARGHDLGRVYYQGSALPDTGIPGTIGGHDVLRVLRAPRAGRFRAVRRIGDRVEAGEIVAYVEEEPVRTAIAGVLRGILADGLEVVHGMKVGDVDPRAEVRHCFTVSDKAWAVGGGVLEAVLCLLRTRGLSPSA